MSDQYEKLIVRYLYIVTKCVFLLLLIYINGIIVPPFFRANPPGWFRVVFNFLAFGIPMSIYISLIIDFFSGIFFKRK